MGTDPPPTINWAPLPRQRGGELRKSRGHRPTSDRAGVRARLTTATKVVVPWKSRGHRPTSDRTGIETSYHGTHPFANHFFEFLPLSLAGQIATLG